MLAQHAVVPDGQGQKSRFSGHRDDLARQAVIAGKLGSPFVEQVLHSAWRHLDNAPRLAARIDGWPSDFAADAVAMRLNAGLHALARSGRSAALANLYRKQNGDFDRAIAAALAAHEDELLTWLDWPTQTNEVARSSAFMAALLVLADERPLPVELLEIGTSAGLNLNLAHYRHILGGRVCGDTKSSLTIEPEWAGPCPPGADVTIANAAGVDLRPIDASNAAARERMMAFVWADRTDRADRLAAALDIAQRHRPMVEQGHALDWIAARLANPQPAGVRRVVMHSMVAQYMSSRERRGALDCLIRAGSRATADRPLAWISLEWTRDRREVQLQLTEWGGPTGEGVVRTLAICHPYGHAIAWLPAAGPIEGGAAVLHRR